MSQAMQAHIVRVKYEKGQTGLIYASSPDLKGLLVAEHTFEELEEAVPQAITELYAACGVNVVVTWTDKREDGVRSWVAFPAELAARELAARRANQLA